FRTGARLGKNRPGAERYFRGGIGSRRQSLVVLLRRRRQVRWGRVGYGSLSPLTVWQPFRARKIDSVNKRTFLKLASMLMATPVLSPMLAWAGEKLKNWAGNVEYSTEQLYAADSLEQVKNFVTKKDSFKVLGTRHCFNKIADSTNGFLSLKRIDKVVALDPEARTVTIEAGMTYGQLCPYLDSKGFALHNLASLPHISVAGACSTGTHGSGDKNGNLATAVSALEFIAASGDTVKLSLQHDGDTFL